MADDIRLTDHDKVVAADEIGNVKHIRTKMQFGAENSATDVSAENPLPVSIGGGTINVDISSGTLNTVISSGLIGVLSGRVAITSGEVHVMSGQVNAYIQSGNVNSYITSGNINILNSGTVVSPTNPFPVTYVASGGSSAIPVSFAGGSLDAFGRLRVSNPFTIFDSAHRYQNNDKWDYVTSGSASTSFDANGSFVNLTTGTTSGNQVVSESKRVMVYQPGKSLLSFNTFTMSKTQENLRQRVGYFGAQNGIYFEVDDSTAYFVKRTFISGSPVNFRVPQNNWNVDKLNGSGPTGHTLNDFGSSLILWLDVEWLGVGDIRCGFIFNGQYVHCHTFEHTPLATSDVYGSGPISGTYMTTACLPLRAEVTNKGPLTSGSANLKQICSTVISEAGFQDFNKRYNVDLGTTEKTLSDDGTLYPILSIRLASGRTDSVIVPVDLDILVTSNQRVLYRLLKNATLSGTSWTTHYNGNVQYDKSATSLASGSGVDLLGGYVNTGSEINVSAINNFNFQLGRTVNQVSDVITLAIAPTAPSTKVLAELEWLELT